MVAILIFVLMVDSAAIAAVNAKKQLRTTTSARKSRFWMIVIFIIYLHNSLGGPDCRVGHINFLPRVDTLNPGGPCLTSKNHRTVRRQEERSLGVATL